MSYNFDSFVNRKEAETLKEMIFQRTKEKAEALTSNIQADVMDIARASFESSHNPFAQILKTAEKSQTVDSETKEEKIPNNQNEIKSSSLHQFVEKPEKNQKKSSFEPTTLNSNAAIQNKLIKEQIAVVQVKNAMEEARSGLASRKSFIGALEFLNSQAAISLLKTRADKFEALA